MLQVVKAHLALVVVMIIDLNHSQRKKNMVILHMIVNLICLLNTKHNNIEAEPAPKSDVKTSVKVHNPPGGKSSITFA